MHTFASTELVDAVLGSLASHRFGPLVQVLPKEPGRREARWVHLLGPVADIAARPSASSRSAGRRGRYRGFHDAVLAGDWNGAIDQLARDVTFRSPAVHGSYEGRLATATVLRAVGRIFEDFRYVDVLDEGDRAVLVFRARVGDRDLEGVDLLRFDDDGLISELTVMLRPLSALQAVVTAMQAELGTGSRSIRSPPATRRFRRRRSRT